MLLVSEAIARRNVADDASGNRLSRGGGRRVNKKSEANGNWSPPPTTTTTTEEVHKKGIEERKPVPQGNTDRELMDNHNYP